MIQREAIAKLTVRGLSRVSGCQLLLLVRLRTQDFVSISIEVREKRHFGSELTPGGRKESTWFSHKRHLIGIGFSTLVAPSWALLFEVAHIFAAPVHYL
jgi:hypothetical protein